MGLVSLFPLPQGAEYSVVLRIIVLHACAIFLVNLEFLAGVLFDVALWKGVLFSCLGQLFSKPRHTCSTLLFDLHFEGALQYEPEYELGIR